MQIAFEFIPRHLQTSIAEKLYFEDYINFEKTSKLSNEVANEIRTFVTVPVLWINRDDIYSEKIQMEENGVFVLKYGDYDKKVCYRYSPDVKFRFEIESVVIFVSYPCFSTQTSCFHDVFDDVFCMEAIDFFVKTKSSADELAFFDFEITCSPINLETFLTVAGARRFSAGQDITFTLPVEYCRIPSLKKMDHLSICSELNDDDLLSFKAKTMDFDIDNLITGRGINRLIKEFLSGTRDLVTIEIRQGEPIDIEAVLEDVPHSVLNLGPEDTLIEFGTHENPRWMSTYFDEETPVLLISNKREFK